MEFASNNAKERYALFAAGKNHYRIELPDFSHQVGFEPLRFSGFFQSPMSASGLLKFESLRSLIAFSFKFPSQRFTIGIQESDHACKLALILFIRTAFEARREAHVHLRIDAAGVRRVRIKVWHTSADFKKIQEFPCEALRNRAGGKRAVVKRVILKNPAGKIAARKPVPKINFHQHGPFQSQTSAEMARIIEPIQKKKQPLGLKIRSHTLPFNPARHLAQIQASGNRFWRGQQPTQAPAQVAGLSQIGLSSHPRLIAWKDRENRRTRWENIEICFRAGIKRRRLLQPHLRPR